MKDKAYNEKYVGIYTRSLMALHEEYDQLKALQDREEDSEVKSVLQHELDSYMESFNNTRTYLKAAAHGDV